MALKGIFRVHRRLLFTDLGYDALGVPRKRAPSSIVRRESFMQRRLRSNLRAAPSQPSQWYPAGKYDDLPAKYRGSVNETVPPCNRPEGDTAAQNGAEIDAVLAFLGTLNDAPMSCRA